MWALVAGVAQLVERATLNRLVVGSSPTTRTKFFQTTAGENICSSKACSRTGLLKSR